MLINPSLGDTTPLYTCIDGDNNTRVGHTTPLYNYIGLCYIKSLVRNTTPLYTSGITTSVGDTAPLYTYRISRNIMSRLFYIVGLTTPLYNYPNDTSVGSTAPYYTCIVDIINGVPEVYNRVINYPITTVVDTTPLYNCTTSLDSASLGQYFGELPRTTILGLISLYGKSITRIVVSASIPDSPYQKCIMGYIDRVRPSSTLILRNYEVGELLYRVVQHITVGQSTPLYNSTINSVKLPHYTILVKNFYIATALVQVFNGVGITTVYDTCLTSSSYHKCIMGQFHILITSEIPLDNCSMGWISKLIILDLYNWSIPTTETIQVYNGVNATTDKSTIQVYNGVNTTTDTSIPQLSNGQFTPLVQLYNGVDLTSIYRMGFFCNVDIILCRANSPIIQLSSEVPRSVSVGITAPLYNCIGVNIYNSM